MGEPTWSAYPETYNALTIGASRTFTWLETKVTVEGTAGASRWDVKEAPNTDGASIRFKGYTPAKPTVSWLLWTVEHELEFGEFMTAVVPKPGKTPPSRISVLHPDLMRFGLMLFFVEDVAIPKRVEPGVLEVTLKLIQWFDQPKPSKTANTSGQTLKQYAAFPLIAGALTPDEIAKRDSASGRVLDALIPTPPSKTKPRP